MSLRDMLEAAKRRSLSSILEQVRSKRAVIAPRQVTVQVQDRPARQQRKTALVPESVQTFVIRKDQVEAAERKARELGVGLELKAVDPRDLIHTWPPYEETVYAFTRDRTGYEAARDAALATMAAGYVYATARAPQPAERVVGVASSEDSVVQFTVIPGEQDVWTPERMDALDLTRCDACGIRHRRSKVYLVLRPGGSVIQVGGTCAENMDLSKRVSNMLRAFKAFASWFGKISADEDWDTWGGGGGKGERGRVDPATALVLADALIATKGYVSRKASDEESGKLPTSELVKQLMLAKPGTEAAAARASILERHGRDAEKLLAQGVAWAQAEQRKKDSSFARNMIAALSTGSVKLLGFLAYVPAGIRRAAADQAERAARSAGVHAYAPPIRFVATKVGEAQGNDDKYSPRAVAFVSLIQLWPPPQGGPVLELLDAPPFATVRKYGMGSGTRIAVDPRAGEVAELARELAAGLLASNVKVRVKAYAYAEYAGDADEDPNEPISEHVKSRAIRKALERAFSEAFKVHEVDPVVNGSDLVRVYEAWPRMVPLLGLSLAVIDKARKAPDKPVAKAVAKKVSTFIPGLWTVTRRHTFESEYGTTVLLSLRRSDGAALEWRAGISSTSATEPSWDEGRAWDDWLGKGNDRSPLLDVGDQIEIWRADLGYVPLSDERYGPSGRRIGGQVRWNLVVGDKVWTPFRFMSSDVREQAAKKATSQRG